jgi:hypothetical protein
MDWRDIIDVGYHLTMTFVVAIMPIAVAALVAVALVGLFQ